MNLKDPTAQMIIDIARLVDKGDSLSKARKKIVGTEGGDLCRCIKKHDLYLILLNEYFKGKNLRTRYKRISGKLVAVK